MIPLNTSYNNVAVFYLAVLRSNALNIVFWSLLVCPNEIPDFFNKPIRRTWLNATAIALGCQNNATKQTKLFERAQTGIKQVNICLNVDVRTCNMAP